MKWTAGNRDNVEDVRSRSGGGMRLGGLGIGGLLLVLILSWATGVDFLSLMGPDAISTGPSVSTGSGGESRTTPEEEKLVDFVDAVMKDAQEMWQGTLGGRYQQTRAVIFRDAIQSACGSAQSATGPFYCPADSLVYLDLGFFASFDSGSARRAILLKPTCLPTNLDTTCNTCSASSRRSAASSRRAQSSRTSCRSGSSCRLTVSLASGVITPHSRAGPLKGKWSSNPGTSTKG